METHMSATQAVAEAGVRSITLGFADGDSTVSISLPLDAAVILSHRLGQAVKQSSGYRPAPSREAAA